MNLSNLEQIFTHYAERFSFLNDQTNDETYKWKIACQFRPMMEKALSASSADFPAALYEVKKLTCNLIDNYTQPFNGLCQFAKERPERVRQMFRLLFAGEACNTEETNKKILAFLRESHALRDELCAGSFLFSDDYRSVSAYLFLFDPDHHYFFKPTHALAFADCIGFYEDWGNGTDIRLDVYTRMCDEVLKAALACPILMAADESRFKDKNGLPRKDLYPDKNKHILLFDLLYCCSTYHLFDGISYDRPDSGTRRQFRERKEAALLQKQQLEKAKAKKEMLEEAVEYLRLCFQPGETVRHRLWKEGTVLENNGDSVVISFSVGTKKTDPVAMVCGGLVTVASPKWKEAEKYLPVLKQRTAIKSELEEAEKRFAELADVLD